MTVEGNGAGGRHSVSRYVLLSCGLLVLLGLAFADFLVKHQTTVGPSTRLEADGPRGTRPLAADRLTDGLPERMFWDDDAYYWLSFAHSSIEERTLRLRHTKIDNVPYGREIDWCSGPTWLLLALATPVHLVGERSLDESLSLAALALHPLLFTLLLIGTAWLTARKVGPLAALGLAGSLLLAPVLARDMSYGTLDHHALLLLFVTGMLLCLQLGGAYGVARRWTIASAICAGAGLWVQAIFQSLLIGGVLLGAMLGGFLFARGRYDGTDGSGGSLISEPELWRTWGRAAAATSFVFYLVERFPSNLGMRLEVNHPLYSIAVLAGGEMTYRILRLLQRPSRRGFVAELPVLAFCTLGTLSPLIAVLLGPADWFWLRDPLLQRVHETIVGYQSAPTLLYHSGPFLRVLIGELGALPLLGLGAFYVLIRHRGTKARCARITVALVPAVVALLLYHRYARNGGLAVTVLIGLGFATLIPVGGRTIRRGLVTATALLLLAGGGFAWYLDWHNYHPFVGTDRFAPGWIRKMDYRDLAHELRARVPEDERRVMTGSDLAPSLAYFGGFAVTSGLYWENRDGLRATIDFFGTHDDEQARAIVERRGIRYVIFWAGPPAVQRWHRLRYGHTDPESVRRTLGQRLAVSEQIPDWLQEITSEFPRTAQPFQVKIYRVVRDSPLPMIASDAPGDGALPR